MKRFGVKLLAVLLCALPAQTARAFDYFYTPTFNKIPILTIVEPPPGETALRNVAGDLQLGVFPGGTEAVISDASVIRPTNSSAQSRSKQFGFSGFAVLNDTSVLPERSFRAAYRRQPNKDRRFKQFERWRPLLATVARRTLG